MGRAGEAAMLIKYKNLQKLHTDVRAGIRAIEAVRDSRKGTIRLDKADDYTVLERIDRVLTTDKLHNVIEEILLTPEEYWIIQLYA